MSADDRSDLYKEQAREAVAMYQEEREKNRQHEATIYQLESVLAEVTNLVDPIQVRGDLKSGWNMLRKEIRNALGINETQPDQDPA